MSTVKSPQEKSWMLKQLKKFLTNQKQRTEVNPVKCRHEDIQQFAQLDRAEEIQGQ